MEDRYSVFFEEHEIQVPATTRFMDFIYEMESRMGNRAGIVFGVFFVVLFSIFNKILLRPENDMTFPHIQVMYICKLTNLILIAFLVVFILNFYLIRSGNIKPYIEDPLKNNTAQKAGISTLVSLITMLYC